MSMDDKRGMRKAKCKSYMDCTADCETVVQFFVFGLFFCFFAIHTHYSKTMCGIAVFAIIFPVCKTSITCEVVVV